MCSGVSIKPLLPQASVPLPLAQSFEPLDREIALRNQIARPAPGQPHRHFMRVLPAPMLQVGAGMRFSLFGLVALSARTRHTAPAFQSDCP